MRTALVYAVAAAAVVGGRGCLLAHLTGTRYALRSLIVETAALLALLLALRLVDGGVRRAVRRLLPPRDRVRRVTASLVHGALVVSLVGPFIVATLWIHPQRLSCRGTPATFGLDWEEVEIRSRGRRLNGWHLPSDDPHAPVALVAHGLGANKENFLPAVATLRRLGLAVVVFDFPGHGDSEGWTITFGAREAEDVLAARGWIADRLSDRPVFAVGFSMGAAAVVGAAARGAEFDRVVLDSAFASAETVARDSLLRPFGPLRGPLWWTGCFWIGIWTGVDLRELRPVDHVAALAQRPLLLVHGTADALIPAAESERLAAACGGRSELWLVEDAGHVESMHDPRYPRRLEEFLLPGGAARDGGNGGGRERVRER